VLSPQIIQNLRILQLSTLELEQVVREELERNPLLEEADTASDGNERGEEQSDQSNEIETDSAAAVDLEAVRRDLGGTTIAEPPESARQDTESSQSDSEDFGEMSASDEYTISELMPEDFFSSPAGVQTDDDGSTEFAPGQPPGLCDTILPLLRSRLSEEDGVLAESILEVVDEDGFIRVSPEELAARLDVDVGRVKTIIHQLQRIPPGGIGCADTRECLLVQLELAGYGPDSLECRLLREHWELLKRRQTHRIARLCKVNDDDVREALDRISRLEVRPGRRFGGTEPLYVVPDFSVEWDGDQLVAVPTDDRIPRLRLSARYVDMLRYPTGVPKDHLEFVRKKYEAARMFLRAIESRRRTVKNIVDLIVREQREFFVKGPEHLRPVTLRQVAGVLGVHASTVSRAIANKYLETPFGIFPMKHFFKAGAGNRSRVSIKEKIVSLIESEDKANPYSDDDLTAKLKEEGITISRRTVAKYRAELRLPACSERKGF
ncbi:MAG: RNA polymerase factor sigma-54, partial [candidate division WOR-3 bacterium]